MATPLCLLFLSLPFLFSLSQAGGLPTSSIVQDPCISTQNPYLGISTLSSRTSYAGAQSPVKAAIAAIGNCRSKTLRLSKFLDKLRKTACQHYDMAALQDCHSLLLDSKDQMDDSIRELKKFGKDKNVDHVGNVQAWMSAALTNLDTCSEGLDEGASDGLKEAIGSRIHDVKNLMGDSLGLVNQLSG